MRLMTPSSIIFGSILLAAAANAQCPADPLSNTTWSFHAEEADYNFTTVGGASYIGTFKVVSASAGRTPYTIAGTMTVNTGGGITRLAAFTGTAQLEGQGGTLLFSYGRRSALWQFVFAANCSEISLVSEVLTNPSINQVLDGKALRIDNQQACPANPSTLFSAALAPTGWSFHTEQATYQNTGGLSGVGTFVPGTGGTLTANVTANTGGFGLGVYRNAISAGLYQVYSDCSGGTLQFQVGPAAVQYEFVFADGSYNQLFLVSTNLTTGGRPSEVLSGYARKNTNVGTAGCPVDSLNNTNWAFQAATQDWLIDPGFASIGRFSINRIGDPRNPGQQVLSLSGTETVNFNGNLNRLLPIAGKAQLDGVGGTLQFATGSEGTLWLFAFSNDCKEMYMVNEAYLNPAQVFTNKAAKATAVRVDAPAACPLNPNQLLDSTFAPAGLSITTRTATWSVGPGLSSIGWLNNTASDGRGRSAVRGILSTNVGGSIFIPGMPNITLGASGFWRNQQVDGVYQVYPDCSGGTMSMMVGPFLTEHEFVFADGAYSQILLVGRAQNSNYNGARAHELLGAAKRY